MSIADHLSVRQYQVPQEAKAARLVKELTTLTAHHYAACAPYRKVVDLFAPRWRDVRTLPEIPYLAASLLKSHRLVSAPATSITNVLTSSGTSGKGLTQVAVDAASADAQVRAMSAVLAHVLGPKRLPLLIIDSMEAVRAPRKMAARGAAILGMMKFGRNPCFAVDAELRPDVQVLRSFLERHGSAPFFIFGFTFVVWSVLQQLAGTGVDLSNGILVHGGGWKRLADVAVDNATFKATLRDKTGLQHIHNFYGMVEQIGTLHLEGSDGLFYAPDFADVLIRDPDTLEPLEPGRAGLIQVLSLLPTSYPGHSLLTEDMGVVEIVENGAFGALTKAFRVLGRAPRADVRGCSDVHAFG